MTASICAELARNSAAMVGIATLTMKASTPNMNCADTTIASTHQRRQESTGLSTGFVTIWCIGSGLVRNLLHPSVTAFGHARDYPAGKGRANLARLLHGNWGSLQLFQPL